MTDMNEVNINSLCLVPQCTAPFPLTASLCICFSRSRVMHSGLGVGAWGEGAYCVLQCDYLLSWIIWAKWTIYWSEWYMITWMKWIEACQISPSVCQYPCPWCTSLLWWFTQICVFRLRVVCHGLTGGTQWDCHNGSVVHCNTRLHDANDNSKKVKICWTHGAMFDMEEVSWTLMCWSHAPPCVALWWMRSQVQTFPFQGCVVGLEVAHGGTLLLCVLCVFYMYQVYMDLSSGSHVSVPSPMGLPFVVGMHTDDVHFRCRMRRCSVEGWHMVGLVWWDYYTQQCSITRYHG